MYALILVFALLHDRPISLHSRRKLPSVQTEGAKAVGPNRTPAQESSVPAEAMDKNVMPEPSSLIIYGIQILVKISHMRSFVNTPTCDK